MNLAETTNRPTISELLLWPGFTFLLRDISNQGFDKPIQIYL